MKRLGKKLKPFGRLGILIIVAAFCFAAAGPSLETQALTYKAIQDTNLYKPWYDKNDTTTACTPGGSVSLQGSDTAEKIYNFLVGQGLTPLQAAGVMGNMQAESYLNPQQLQGTAKNVNTAAEAYMAKYASVPMKDHPGWGLVQWTPGDKFITTNSPVSQANDLGTQLTFLWNQLEGKPPLPEKQAGNDLKATTTLRDAVLAFQGNTKVGGSYVGYERPKDQSGSVSQRLANAQGFLNLYGSSTPPPPGSTTDVKSCSATSSGDAVTGGYSLPTDKIWYTQHPDWFTKAHRGYPAADIPVPTGTKIYSMTAGKVIKAPIVDITCSGCSSGSYGRGVEIDAGNGVTIIYAHGLDGGSIPGAKENDTVSPGQLIMHSASTGNSTGPHLHLEIKVNGTSVCPQSLLKAIATGAPIPDIKTLPASGCTN